MIGKKINAALRAVGPGLEALLEILALLGGAVLVAYGTWLIFRPAGFIMAGMLLVAGVILRARGS